LKTEGKGFPVSKHPDFLHVSHLKNLTSFQAAAVGPGLSKILQIQKWIKRLRYETKMPVILDATALAALSQMKDRKLPANWILTPHEGELARLLAVSAQQIQKDRRYFLELAQRQYGCIILLKGFRTLLSDGKNIFEIQSGNVALAKAGTGDVLTGMILGFLSQQLSPLRASCLAAFIHGKMADDWIRAKKDVLSLMASDLPQVLHQTRI
jgi:ADP-dependent NAD(P)H-hydrate dehydratase